MNKAREQLNSLIKLWKEAEEDLEEIIERGLVEYVVFNKKSLMEGNRIFPEERKFVLVILARGINDLLIQSVRSYKNHESKWSLQEVKVSDACKLFEIGIELNGSWDLEEIRLENPGFIGFEFEIIKKLLIDGMLLELRKNFSHLSVSSGKFHRKIKRKS